MSWKRFVRLFCHPIQLEFPSKLSDATPTLRRAPSPPGGPPLLSVLCLNVCQRVYLRVQVCAWVID
jgi:hypothetical protein